MHKKNFLGEDAEGSPKVFCFYRTTPVSEIAYGHANNSGFRICITQTPCLIHQITDSPFTYFLCQIWFASISSYVFASLWCLDRLPSPLTVYNLAWREWTTLRLVMINNPIYYDLVIFIRTYWVGYWESAFLKAQVCAPWRIEIPSEQGNLQDLVASV